jgi:hypothetical protein
LLGFAFMVKGHFIWNSVAAIQKTNFAIIVAPSKCFRIDPPKFCMTAYKSVRSWVAIIFYRYRLVDHFVPIGGWTRTKT